MALGCVQCHYLSIDVPANRLYPLNNDIGRRQETLVIERIATVMDNKVISLVLSHINAKKYILAFGLNLSALNNIFAFY